MMEFSQAIILAWGAGGWVCDAGFGNRHLSCAIPTVQYKHISCCNTNSGKGPLQVWGSPPLPPLRGGTADSPRPRPPRGAIRWECSTSSARETLSVSAPLTPRSSTTARLDTTFSSKVHLHHTIDIRGLCAATLVTRWSRSPQNRGEPTPRSPPCEPAPGGKPLRPTP